MVHAIDKTFYIVILPFQSECGKNENIDESFNNDRILELHFEKINHDSMFLTRFLEKSFSATQECSSSYTSCNLKFSHVCQHTVTFFSVHS